MFKALLGFEEVVVLQYLRRVEVREDYKKVFEAVKREKKRTILRNIFQEKTKCSTWEEAENLYEPYVSIVDDYIGKDELN